MTLFQQDPQPSPPFYRYLDLSKGQRTRLDVAVYIWAVRWSWYAGWNPNTQSYYAMRSEYAGIVDGKKKILSFRMHREILGFGPGDPAVDHHNGDTLDNTIENLRPATHSQSNANRGKMSTNTSGLKGVSWHIRIKKWSATVCLNGKIRHLGYYDTKEEAYGEYCKAALQLHGEFARLA